MVSTRNVKYKFFEGERVLCYEPDPTKTKVLYDSKVLEVIVNKDHRGKKVVEYLIHFQGWNSSWDRCVCEELVLKDTPENRQLQKDLADKAQLQIGSYLYRKERKKQGRKLNNERTTLSSEEGSCGSPPRIDMEESNSSSIDSSSIDEDNIPIELTDELRMILEQDCDLINNASKLVKLPAEPNVVAILEMYWKHYAMSLLLASNNNNDKTNSRSNNKSHKSKCEELQRNMNLCKEMLDGLRIYFDFTLNELLLYGKEKNQIETAQATFNSLVPSIKQNVTIRGELEDLEYAHLPNMEVEDYENTRTVGRRRGLRSSRSTDDSNGIHQESSTSRTTLNSLNSSEITGSATKILSWRLLPEHVYSQQPLPPCLVYGAIHLLRLFVKLPELLNSSNIPDNKLNILLRHLEDFISFLTHHKEWYGEKFYAD